MTLESIFQGDGESDDEDGDGDNAAGASHTVNRQGAVGELPPSESDSDDSGEDKASKQVHFVTASWESVMGGWAVCKII